MVFFVTSAKLPGRGFSPKNYTQHQLFAVLVLKSFLKTDYCGVAKHLSDCSALAAAVQLRKIPHFTTLQKASRRLSIRTIRGPLSPDFSPLG